MKNVCIEYAKVGDYLLPCLTPPESPKIGKYGRMCLRHLATHERAVYNGMLFDGTLKEYLESVDRCAEAMMERLITQMTEIEGITEQLKAENQMEWVRQMNSIRNQAEEIVLQEVVYA